MHLDDVIKEIEGGANEILAMADQRIAEIEQLIEDADSGDLLASFQLRDFLLEKIAIEPAVCLAAARGYVVQGKKMRMELMDNVQSKEDVQSEFGID